MIDKNSECYKLYREFKKMQYDEQMEFAFSLENEEERNFFVDLANIFMRERFKKVVDKGLFK